MHIERNRIVILLLIVIFIFGLYDYIKMPRESDPDIQIPVISVFIRLPGISVEDSEKLLAIPTENELRSIEGVKELKALATNDGAHVILKFGTEYSSKEVLDNVCSKLSNIKSKLPAKAESPVISEINLSLFLILNVGLVGHLPERALTDIAHKLKKGIESLPNFLKVEVASVCKETIEIIIEPTILTKYNIQIDTVNQVKYLIDKAKDQLPENLKVVHLNDQSKNICNVLDDLENGIIFAVLLILIIIILSMGTRTTILVAPSIPGLYIKSKP